MLEAGLRLQGAGFKGVGVATGELNARWKTFNQETEQERLRLEEMRTLRRR